MSSFRYLWAVLIAGNTLVFVILTYVVLDQLMYPDIATKVGVEFSTVPTFPAVTLCNANQFKVHTCAVMPV